MEHPPIHFEHLKPPVCHKSEARWYVYLLDLVRNPSLGEREKKKVQVIPVLDGKSTYLAQAICKGLGNGEKNWLCLTGKQAGSLCIHVDAHPQYFPNWSIEAAKVPETTQLIPVRRLLAKLSEGSIKFLKENGYPLPEVFAQNIDPNSPHSFLLSIVYLLARLDIAHDPNRFIENASQGVLLR